MNAYTRYSGDKTEADSVQRMRFHTAFSNTFFLCVRVEFYTVTVPYSCGISIVQHERSYCVSDFHFKIRARIISFLFVFPSCMCMYRYMPIYM